MIFLISIVQLILGLFCAIGMGVGFISLVRVILLMNKETSNLGLSSFWEFRSYSQQTKEDIKKLLLKSILLLLSVLLFAFIANWIQVLKI